MKDKLLLHTRQMLGFSVRTSSGMGGRCPNRALALPSAILLTLSNFFSTLSPPPEASPLERLRMVVAEARGPVV